VTIATVPVVVIVIVTVRAIIVVVVRETTIIPMDREYPLHSSPTEEVVYEESHPPPYSEQSTTLSMSFPPNKEPTVEVPVDIEYNSS